MMTSRQKKVAILQSNYIPWKGYFDMINLVDEFILGDDVQYTKGDWRNRNRIKTPNGLKWLTIPVKHTFPQTIRETVVSDPKWGRKHWNSIVPNYSKAPYFRQYREIFQELYLGEDELSLSRINYRFIVRICQLLGIQTTISWSTDYHIPAGSKTERLIALCKQSGATTYISGPAAKVYIDEKLFKNENIRLSYMDYSDYPEYHQFFPPFGHDVSILDLLFHEGSDASKYMNTFK